MKKPIEDRKTNHAKMDDIITSENQPGSRKCGHKIRMPQIRADESDKSYNDSCKCFSDPFSSFGMMCAIK